MLSCSIIFRNGVKVNLEHALPHVIQPSVRKKSTPITSLLNERVATALQHHDEVINMKLRLRRVLVLKSCYKIWVDLLRRHCRRCEEANDINISRRTPPQQFTVFQKTSNHPLETGRESKRPECCPETEPSAQNRASFRGSSKLCTNFERHGGVRRQLSAFGRHPEMRRKHTVMIEIRYWHIAPLDRKRAD